MSFQVDGTSRSGFINSWITAVGTSAKLRLLTGPKETNCAATETGTLVCQMTLASTWLTESGGVGTKAGTWSGTSAAAGLIGHARFMTSGGTCKGLGSMTQAFKLTTNASTTALSNVLHFASATGVVAGMNVYGTGVPTGAKVAGVSGGDVTLDISSTAGVSSGVDIYFGTVTGDLWMDDPNVGAPGMTVTINAFTITAPGA